MTHSEVLDPKKEEAKRDKRHFLVILAIVFLGFIGISIPYLIFPPLFLNPLYSIFPQTWTGPTRALLLGITLAIYPIGQFIGSPILGTLSDVYGRKRILSGSLLLSALSNFFTAIAIVRQQLVLLILARFISGLMEGNIAIARAMAAEIKTISKHNTLGKINAVSSIAYLLGPLIGGMLSDHNLFGKLTTASPFFFCFILFLFLSGGSLFLRTQSSTRSIIEKGKFWSSVHFTKTISSLFANRRLKVLLIASTCFTLAVDIFYEFGPVYLTVKWMLTPVRLILFNGVLCIGLTLGNGWLAGFVSKRMVNGLAFTGAVFGFALSLLGIVMVNSVFWIALFFGICGMMIGLAVTLITVRISDSVSDSIQGQVMGTQLSLRMLGDGLICLFGGVFLMLSSRLILFLAVALSLGVILYLRKNRTSQASVL